MRKSVIVTGGSKGIGRAVAVRLASDGFVVAVHYNSDPDGAAATLAEMRSAGGDGRTIKFDVSNRAECREAIEADIAANGPYWGIVLNAGIIRDNTFVAMEDDEWDLVLQTNLGGFYNVLRPSVMPIVSAHKGGRIVTMSSVSGLVGNRGQVNYSASKAGIIGATKALALELARRKITVNCVVPGVIETQMISGLPTEEILKLIPMRRIGKPDDVAATVAFLMSEGAGYITRQVIAVNGGMV